MTAGAPRKAGRRWKAKVSARDQLLMAASSLMIEKETIDIPLGEIAQRAGLNSALVSYYFGGKEGLLMALAKRDTAQAVREMDALMATGLLMYWNRSLVKKWRRAADNRRPARPEHVHAEAGR